MYNEVGGPEVLFVTEVEDPSPDARKVLVAVEAAGLNPYDAKARGGFIPSDAPFTKVNQVQSIEVDGVLAFGANATGVFEDAQTINCWPSATGLRPRVLALLVGKQTSIFVLG